MLGHVGGESCRGELVQRREQRARNDEETETVEHGPPDRGRVSGGVEPAPPSQIGDRRTGQRAHQKGLESHLGHRPGPPRSEVSARPSRAVNISWLRRSSPPTAVAYFFAFFFAGPRFMTASTRFTPPLPLALAAVPP